MSEAISAGTVLLKVARCPNAAAGASCGTPCEAIVAAQGSRGKRFHVPEPWRGDIMSAPLLFISSNPSWNPDDDSPTSAATDDEIARYYTEGFPSVFPRAMMRNGEPGKRAVAFWSAIRARAAELYDRPKESIVAGKDFALTEVVHCKSRDEIGVREATEECAGRHLDAVMRLSPARVIVILGRVAGRVLGAVEIGRPIERELHGKRRWIVTLPHPNAHQRRTFAALCVPEQLARLRKAVR